jgi:hypothetical protein
VRLVNVSGTSEQAREVIMEYSLKIEGRNKAPDYCFRAGGADKFFVEAKKPAVNLQSDARVAFQTRAYGWNRSLPFCILTDFEEFAVYDCRFKPVATDSAQTARTFYCKFSEYPQKWPEIESLFGRAAVQNGALEMAASKKSKKGAQPFDADFLQLIEGWRERLAHTIAQRNRDLNLSQSDLNYAVQMTIDRILFLRMCEDRDIEPFEQLKKISQTRGVYGELCELFRQADNRFNSGLFHFTAKKARRGTQDTFTLDLKIDDDVLQNIIYHLYPPGPYNFRVMSVEILGQVYEQFLGKVIRFDGRKAVVEDKPEVRKAGGVYYTPEYIVRYIVENTLGKLCAGKTPKDVETLKVLDPACGSGSFLIGAYQFLLDWHLEYYRAHGPEKWATRKNPVVFQTQPAPDAPPVWRLTSREKKRILLSNIYGVDIDRQAVEVTKLSLLLKMLEDESAQTLPAAQGRLLPSQERLLPDLEANIKCGNSLIGHDFYESGAEYSQQERSRINAFDWNDEFPEIMQRGGFDAVIGNPPYIRIQALKEWAPLEVEYLKRQYKSASVGNYDIYVVFVERALELMNKSGLMGYILPHKFFNAQYGAPLREILAEGAHLSDVVHFGHQQIFENATTYTCLLFTKREKSKAVNIAKVENLAEWRATGVATTGEVPAHTLNGDEWNFAIGKDAALLKKLAQMPMTLDDVTQRIFVGIQTSADPVYVLSVVSENASFVTAYSSALDTNVKLERKILMPLLKGSEIKRYSEPENQYAVIFPYRVKDNRAHGLSKEEMSKMYPHTFDYLNQNKKRLMLRADVDAESWWLFPYPKNLVEMAKPKLLTQVLAKRASYTIDFEAEYCFVGGGNAGGYGIQIAPSSGLSELYLLGLLNSRLLDIYLHNISTPFRGGYYSYARRFIEQLPIRTINFSNKADKARHDEMVKLVEQMLELHRQKGKARTPSDQTQIERQITATDRKIDRLVYELYELTDEEIALVENENAR